MIDMFIYNVLTYLSSKIIVVLTSGCFHLCYRETYGVAVTVSS